MSVVTITRQYGAGGSEVAQRLAKALDWTLIDNEFVSEVAKRAGLPVATVAAQEERAPSLMQRLVRTLASVSPETIVPSPAASGTAGEPDEEELVRVTGRVIDEAAQHGRAVLVGRGAQAVLASATPGEALHVYVVAPLETRIRTIILRLGVSAKEAEAAIGSTDAARDRYVHKWFGRTRQDPANYHIVLNTGLLGYDAAAELLFAAVKSRGWR